MEVAALLCRTAAAERAAAQGAIMVYTRRREMRRPPKPKALRRSKLFPIRLTPSELADLEWASRALKESAVSILRNGAFSLCPLATSPAAGKPAARSLDTSHEPAPPHNGAARGLEVSLRHVLQNLLLQRQLRRQARRRRRCAPPQRPFWRAARSGCQQLSVHGFAATIPI